jgi:hypothetical protein
MKKGGVLVVALSAASSCMGLLELIVFGIPALLILVALAVWLFGPIVVYIIQHWIIFTIVLVAISGISVAILRAWLRGDTIKYPGITRPPSSRRSLLPSGIDKSRAATAREGENAAGPHLETCVFVHMAASERLTAGANLFAYTDAWLSIVGMFEMRSIDRKCAVQIAGSSMVSYNLRQGYFYLMEGQLSLSPAGMNHFQKRRVPGSRQHPCTDDVSAWKIFLRSGTGPKLSGSSMNIKKIRIR